LGRRLLTALVFGVLVVAIFAVSGAFGGDDTEVPGTYSDFRNQPTACGAEAPPEEQVMSFDAPEPQADITSTAVVTATIATSCGEFVIELNTSDAPATANSFVFLAREGFYDGQVIHRIAENFVFQTGDPQANGTGGPGYIIDDEFPEDGFVYEEGVVAMASRGARSTGSQFFVVQRSRHGRVRSGRHRLDHGGPNRRRSRHVGAEPPPGNGLRRVDRHRSSRFLTVPAGIIRVN